MKRCDIIIPIYNAYDCLKKCIETVIKNTDLNNNGLILIDDMSTDKRINLFLSEIKEKYSNLNITVLNNKENLGFVKTVNKGMKYSENDVLLLNSDTEVSERWLNKIVTCAYSDENVATVTPLSNNATLASVPKCLEKNEIPSHLTLNEYNEIIEKCSYNDYPEIPTAHGFCMYIKRSVLNIVGYFDEETFGKGYGEENDFSYRCLDYGYRHLLCDNTIIYHKESQSFSGEREKVIKKHSDILAKRYPTYVNRQNEWCKNVPIAYIGENITYYLNVNKKKNILILIHDFETKTGGTTLHVMDIINNLKDTYNFHVLTPSKNCYKLVSFFNDEKLEKYFNIPFTFNNLFFYNKDYKRMLNEIIESLNITDVHIHHMIGHYFDIGQIIEEKKLNAIITLHDLYALCPNVNMLYNDEMYCENSKDKNCATCLKYYRKANQDIMVSWHQTWNDFLPKFAKIIVPSNDTKKRINKEYNVDIEVIEHGIEMFKSNYTPTIDKKRHNIALIGVMCNHKGAKIVENLLKQNDKNYKIHLFGKSEFESLTKNKNNYIYHGKYERKNLFSLLKENDIDLICMFSIWPETYSYTLNEAIASGIPVLSFDIGAGAERIKKYGFGWTINIDSSASIINKKITEILSNKNDYDIKINNIHQYQIKSIEEMISEYKKMYSKASKVKEVNTCQFVKNHCFNNNSGYNMELDRILNSTKWKLINKIKFSENMVSLIRKIMQKRKDK